MERKIFVYKSYNIYIDWYSHIHVRRGVKDNGTISYIRDAIYIVHYFMSRKFAAKERCKTMVSHYLYMASARYVKLRVAHAPGMPGTFSPSLRVSDPDMHQGTCVAHAPWCIPESLTSGFLWSQCRAKRSRHSRRMRNPQFLHIW